MSSEISPLFAGVQQSANHKEAEAELARNTLRQFPSLQAETIAKHYTAHAYVALQILELFKVRKDGGDCKNINATIARCVEQIKDAHRRDFGIELEWRNES